MKSGGLMTDGLKSGGLMSGGLKSYGPSCFCELASLASSVVCFRYSGFLGIKQLAKEGWLPWPDSKDNTLKSMVVFISSIQLFQKMYTRFCCFILWDFVHFLCCWILSCGILSRIPMHHLNLGSGQAVAQLRTDDVPYDVMW